MKKYALAIIPALFVAGIVVAQSFTDVDKAANHGKTGLKNLTEEIDANFTRLQSTAGAANGAAVSASENYNTPTKTVLTINDLSVPIAFSGPGTNHTGGVKVYDFPAGRILVLGVTVDSFTVATNAVGIEAADGGDYALGTASASGSSLASTEVDLCPATSIDPITNIVSGALAASAQFDGTTTAKDLYVNMLVDGGDLSGPTTAVVDSATITVTWSNLGDY